MSLNEDVSTGRELYVFPTSFAQQRLWFLNQLEPDSPAYNIAYAIGLRGRLEAGALERSLRELVERHETLRTTFATVEGRPVQVVAPEPEVALPVVDLRGRPAGEREEESRLLAADEARRVFDLARGPLLRAKLLRLSEEEHILLLTMHHIVSDGWSMGVFVRELAALYEAVRDGRSSLLAELPLQYADFAIWQREWLKGDEVAAQLSYWKRQLGGDLPVLDLPFDRPRAAVQSDRGARQHVTLSPELIRRLRALGQKEGVTLYMMLLAAFQTLLYRYTNQEDVCVGSSVAGRTRTELEGLIGFFLNTLVLRTDLSGGPTFRELLGRVREVALQAYANQDVPVEMLLEELRPGRHLGHNPLFQVMFILQNAPLPELRLGDIALSLLPGDNGTSKFDLTLDLTEEGEGVSGHIEYNSDLFDAATVARFAAHFQTLLAAAAERPDTSVASLPLLNAAEEHQLLREWSNQRDPDPCPQGSCLHELFEAQAARTPDAVAVASEDERLSYAELNERANLLAHHLRREGVGPETRVGVLVERSPQMVVSILAVLKAGGAYVPLDPAYPSERLRFMLEDSGARVLLTEARRADAAAGAAPRVVCVDSLRGELERGAVEEARANPVNGVTPDNLAYVIYTSGSTGRPKGVGVQHRSIAAYVETARELYGITPDDRVLQFASVSFDASAEEIYPTLATGATLVLRTDNMLGTVATFLRRCEEWGVTVLDLPTAYWHSIALALDAQQLRTPEPLRLVIIGGEKALRERVGQWRRRARPQTRLVNTYGPTESTIVATSYEVGAEEEEDAREVPIGRAVANAETYVLDRGLRPVPVGVAGELYVGGEGVARGYLGALR
nr:condensation domain-containing protein [uncultured bacterium]